jgi:hypothetical protein
MRRAVAVLAALVVAFPAMSQVDDDGPIGPLDEFLNPIPDVPAEAVRSLQGRGAELRGLDKVSGEVFEFKLGLGDTAKLGRIEITLSECRYPEDNPSGEAYAWLSVTGEGGTDVFFDGWMIASSPALSALDHSRYDVWVIRCTTA